MQSPCTVAVARIACSALVMVAAKGVPHKIYPVDSSNGAATRPRAVSPLLTAAARALALVTRCTRCAADAKETWFDGGGSADQPLQTPPLSK
eukprot:1181563-Prorocentrum_minimum.AAC.5